MIFDIASQRGNTQRVVDSVELVEAFGRLPDDHLRLESVDGQDGLPLELRRRNDGDLIETRRIHPSGKKVESRLVREVKDRVGGVSHVADGYADGPDPVGDLLRGWLVNHPRYASLVMSDVVDADVEEIRDPESDDQKRQCPDCRQNHEG